MGMTTTLVDTGNVILDSALHRDKLLTFAGIATVLAGTILANKRVADAVVAVAGSNTGNGTVTLATTLGGGIVPDVGAYILKCTAVVTNGGVFALFNPNGAQVSSGIAITAGAGVATIVKVAGLQFTVTDGATDFIVGDSFTLTTTAVTGKVVPYSATGAGGAQIATDVLTYDVTSTGAGDVPIRSLVSGNVRKERLIVSPSSAVTEPVIEQLRLSGIVAIECKELGKYDNQ